MFSIYYTVDDEILLFQFCYRSHVSYLALGGDYGCIPKQQDSPKDTSSICILAGDGPLAGILTLFTVWGTPARKPCSKVMYKDICAKCYIDVNITNARYVILSSYTIFCYSCYIEPIKTKPKNYNVHVQEDTGARKKCTKCVQSGIQ